MTKQTKDETCERIPDEVWKQMAAACIKEKEVGGRALAARQGLDYDRLSPADQDYFDDAAKDERIPT